MAWAGSQTKTYSTALILVFVAFGLLVCWLLVRTAQPRTVLAQQRQSAYATPESCLYCHSEIAKSYAQTGMARSFQRLDHASHVKDFWSHGAIYNRASDRSYTLGKKDGAYFVERSQTSWDGQRTNIERMSMDYAIGSGDHARSYLHLSPEGKLLELPVSWYSEQGGIWAMSPGYDAPDQQDFRRAINFECIGCHDAYPSANQIDLRSPDKNIFTSSLQNGLPEGIDCQRCHGPGAEHIRLASRTGTQLEAIRAAIVNPAELSRERQMDVCMQCHLETTSLPLPHSIRRVDRESFSYIPGQPLEEFEYFFDRQAGTSFDQRVEVVNQVYRLAKSQCFLKSQMTCITCHDPHRQRKGAEATAHFISVCRECHRGVHVGGVPSESGDARAAKDVEDCLTCHMPRRRSDDAIHVVLTDHYIQRFKPKGDLLAPLQETAPAYHGEVVPYYPPSLLERPPDELYMALGQTEDGTNLDAGIPRLRAAIESHKPQDAAFYFAMGAAYARAGKNVEALPFFEDALRRRPGDPKTLRAFAAALAAKGDLDRAAAIGEEAAAVEHPDTTVLTNLGEAYLRQGKLDRAQAVLGKALRIDADLPRASVFLGMVCARRGDAAGAEAAYREALRSQPESAEASNNLAGLLSRRGDKTQAIFYMRKAAAAAPDDAHVHGNLALMLLATGKNSDAIAELRRTVELDPLGAAPKLTLANLLLAQDDPHGAEEQLRSILARDPAEPRANLKLGELLARQGRTAEAHACYERAAHGSDSSVKYAAEETLHKEMVQ